MAIYYNTTFPSTSIQYSSSSSSSQWPAPALDHSVSLLLPWNSICNSHLFSFSSGFNIIMSDMDRSSSEDNISVGSQEETNAEYKMDFSQDEEDLITRLYNLLGQRWALIAGRIPGRTAKEIEKYCSRRYGSE